MRVITGLCARQSAGFSLPISKQSHTLLPSWPVPSHGARPWATGDDHVLLVQPEILPKFWWEEEGEAVFKALWEERLCVSARGSCCYWSIITSESNLRD